MKKPTIKQISDLLAHGIVPGAKILCAYDRQPGRVQPFSKWSVYGTTIVVGVDECNGDLFGRSSLYNCLATVVEVTKDQIEDAYDKLAELEQAEALSAANRRINQRIKSKRKLLSTLANKRKSIIVPLSPSSDNWISGQGLTNRKGTGACDHFRFEAYKTGVKLTDHGGKIHVGWIDRHTISAIASAIDKLNS